MPHSTVFSWTRYAASAPVSVGRSLVAAVALVLAPVVAHAADVDPAAGKEIASTVCVACHGADGNSPSAENPILAGQHAEYLAKQLHDFKPGDNDAAPARASAVMEGFAGMLSDDDIRNVAAFFASQKLEPSVARDKDLVEEGQQIYRGGIASKGVPACAACHGPSGAGMPVQYPSLHGQYAEYTARELTAFRQGERLNNVMMSEIAAQMSDVEIRAVSEYIAGLR